ncbi:MAG: hypothetical protein AAGC95_17480 [Pseudomonadota bacterium]
MSMYRFFSSLFVFCVLPAFGVQAELPPALEQAVTHAERFEGDRFAFTLSLETGDGAYVATFDPRLPENARWSLMSPPLEALSADEKKAYDALVQDNTADEDLVYANLRHVIGDDVAVVSETGAEVVYGFTVIEEEKDDVRIASPHIRGEATLLREGAYISKVRYFAPKPFKPNAAAKVERLDIIQTYAPLFPDGPVVNIETVSEVSGKALFRSFEERSSTVYSNVSQVDVED